MDTIVWHMTCFWRQDGCFLTIWPTSAVKPLESTQRPENAASMSRGGTPTDNPIIEALNGWMKEELYLDFDLAHAHDVPALLEAYVDFFNPRRPAAALGYRSPVQDKAERGFC